MISSYHLRVGIPIAVAALCVCAVANAANPTATYVPLRVGNSWTDREIEYYPAAKTYTQVTKITNFTSHLGATWFEARTTSTAYPVVTDYLRNNPYGFLTYNAQYPTPFYGIKTPLVTGNSWVEMSTAYFTIRITITNTNATTTVPAGTFSHCLVTTMKWTPPTQPTITVKTWYAPNKGAVRSMSWMGTKLTSVGVLISSVVG